MRFRLDSAKLATVALSAVLGLQVAWLIAGIFIRSNQSQPTPEALAQNPPETEIAAAITASGLFGEESSVSVIQSSSSNLVLAGVLAEEDPKSGQSIIAERGGPARVYRPGAVLPGGLLLQAVHPDHVLFERGGRLERLDLPRQGSGQTLNKSASPTAMPTITGLPSALPDTSLAAAIRWQAILRPGMPSGVRVYPGADAQAFSRLGLEAGDLVIALNDAPLADQANGEQFLRSLTGMPQATLTVERGGQVQKILIDFAGLTRIGAN